MSLRYIFAVLVAALLVSWTQGASAADNNTAPATHTAGKQDLQGDDMEMGGEDTDEGIVADDEPVADEPIVEEGPDESGE